MCLSKFTSTNLPSLFGKPVVDCGCASVSFKLLKTFTCWCLPASTVIHAYNGNSFAVRKSDEHKTNDLLPTKMPIIVVHRCHYFLTKYSWWMWSIWSTMLWASLPKVFQVNFGSVGQAGDDQIPHANCTKNFGKESRKHDCQT